MAYQGKFKPRNPSKYRGNVKNIVYRSSWELKFFIKCDTNPNILKWASEEPFMVIPYYSEVDGKNRRYFPDVWVKTKTKSGSIVETLIEIKPFKETIEPVKRGKKKTQYLREVKTYIVNKNKWDAAEKVCKKKGWNFKKMTENELGIK